MHDIMQSFNIGKQLLEEFGVPDTYHDKGSYLDISMTSTQLVMDIFIA